MEPTQFQLTELYIAALKRYGSHSLITVGVDPDRFTKVFLQVAGSGAIRDTPEAMLNRLQDMHTPVF